MTDRTMARLSIVLGFVVLVVLAWAGIATAARPSCDAGGYYIQGPTRQDGSGAVQADIPVTDAPTYQLRIVNSTDSPSVNADVLVTGARVTATSAPAAFMDEIYVPLGEGPAGTITVVVVAHTPGPFEFSGCVYLEGGDPPPTTTTLPEPCNLNDVECWCPDGGVKFEPVSTPFEVPPGTWSLAVIKAGSDESNGDYPTHYVVENPQPGDLLTHPSGRDISHVILCGTIEEDPPSTTTTISPTTTTTPSTVPTTTTPPPTTTTAPTTTTTTPEDIGSTTTTTTPSIPTTTTPEADTTTTTIADGTTSVPPTTPTDDEPTITTTGRCEQTGDGWQIVKYVYVDGRLARSTMTGTECDPVLPHTGADLGWMALGGVAAVAFGLMLRRWAS